MFLRVQHFQQADRWTEGLVQGGRARHPAASLGRGRDGSRSRHAPYRKVRCQRLPRCDAGRHAVLHSGRRRSAAAAGADRQRTRRPRCILAMPLRKQGAFETGSERREDAGTRYRRTQREAPDANSGSFANASLEVGRARAELFDFRRADGRLCAVAAGSDRRGAVRPFGDAGRQIHRTLPQLRRAGGRSPAFSPSCRA